MIDLVWVYLYIVLVHWISDFILQSNEMAQNKSTSNVWLTKHVIVYTMVTNVLWIPIIFVLNLKLLTFEYFLAMSLIFVTHWITDYITSKLNSKYWRLKDTHSFFVSIGFDQLLHYTQLFLIFRFLLFK